jgi:serine/threonine protein kinase
MRVINGSDINNFILDIEKLITLYSFNFVSISPAECIFKTEEKTFIMNKFNPYYEGGPLFYHLKNSGTFTEKKAKIISAQIINIILFFHKKKKKHLNFSPENFILDKNGYVNYLWFEINEKLFLDKFRPEILKPLEYTQVNNDWYNLGILIYEMLFHISPLSYMDLNGKIRFPKFFEISDEAKEIIEKLISMKNESDDMELEDIKKYKFFEDINFDDISNRKFEAGIIPMNLEIQKLNNVGIATDEKDKDEKEEMEKERYTLFNYDSNDENDDDIESD